MYNRLFLKEGSFIGPIQLTVVISLFVFIKNHMSLFEDKKNVPIYTSIFEAGAIIVIILLLEYFFPFLR
ncbi:Uncharacterised protein [Bacillus freudenreichii]|nr:Uncharacterised protein [Bacillus freudenreichii]